MDILKFLKSFNNVNTYLCLAIILLIVIVVKFYIISPS